MFPVRKVLSVVVVCLLGMPAVAQELPPSVLACSSEADSLKRLMCFDREIARFKPGQKAQSEGVAPAPSSATSVTPSSAPVASSPPTSSPQAIDDFGVSGKLARRRQLEETDREKPVQQIESTITRVSQKPYGEFVFELENGQVWEQPERKFGLTIKEGEKVRINRGAMGSYFLTADSGGTTRVRRVR